MPIVRDTIKFGQMSLDCRNRSGLAAALLAGLLAVAVDLALAEQEDPYPSTYTPPRSNPVLIRDATVLTGTGSRLDHSDVLLVAGKIEAVGTGLGAPEGAVTIDAANRWVTPGLIDIHSHVGVHSSLAIWGAEDVNEATSPSTANVWVEHSIWPMDPGFEAALAGGITTLEVLPGSANLIGGRTVVLKNVPSATYQGMKFPGAPQGLKMACGENPKRVYGGRNAFPSTRMGNVAGDRAQWIEAQEYERDWKLYRARLARGDAPDATKIPKRDLRLETLAAALRGEIPVQMHCYRADDMATMLDMSREFGFRIAAFHHAVEAYKIANLLAERSVCAAMWADWWGFKLESYDGIQENLALVDAAGGCAIVHSDSDEDIQRLNQEAAKGMSRGIAVGLPIAPEHAIRWLTANPARALGIASQTGTLEAGKMADVVVWNRDPFSVYALVDQVYIDGVLQYDRAAPKDLPRSDFMLGQPSSELEPH